MRWPTRFRRTDTLWLTSLDRNGDALTIQGTAGSINAVANFITELKTSGYFDQVEIKESTQDPKTVADRRPSTLL